MILFLSDGKAEELKVSCSLTGKSIKYVTFSAEEIKGLDADWLKNVLAPHMEKPE